MFGVRREFRLRKKTCIRYNVKEDLRYNELTVARVDLADKGGVKSFCEICEISVVQAIVGKLCVLGKRAEDPSEMVFKSFSFCENL